MKNNTWEDFIKPVVVLAVIALIVSAALAAINNMTAPVIEENNRVTTLNAYMSVLPTAASTDDLESIDQTFTNEKVVGAVRTSDGSVAVKAEEKGFDGGVLTAIVGFDADGNIVGTWVDATTQTAGVGSHVSEDKIKDQFVGQNASVETIELGNGFDAYTGATISSKALLAAVNDCISAYNEVA